MAVIALDLGGTKLACSIFQPNGTSFNRLVLPLENRTGSEVGQMISQAITEQMRHADSEGTKVESIGCCVPGIVYADSGRVWAPNIPGWDDFPLRRLIREVTGDENIGVILDSDRACSIMGEVWQGSARGCKDAIFLAVGTGIGAGILIDGKILRGSSDIAGAIGWLALAQPFHEKYVTCGCFEYHASGDGLARVAREYLQNLSGNQSILSNLDPAEITAHTIFDAYKKGDQLATEVLKQAIVFWGMTVANLVSLFNPEKIIFGGGVFGPAVEFLDDIQQEARKWAQPISMQQVQLSASKLGSDAALTGAAYLALKSTNDNAF